MNNKFTIVLGETPVTFDLFESPIVNLWKQILVDAKEHNCPLAFSARQFGEDLQVLSDRMSDTMSSLANNHDFDLPQWSGVNNGEVNQFELNALHEQFHRQEDELSRVDTQTTIGDEKELTKLLNIMNVTIHSIEATRTNFEYAVGSIDFEHVKHMPAEKLRIPISDDIRKYFIGLPPDTIMPSNYTCFIELGYHTIGKNIRMCWRDDDVELIKQNLNSPQLKISSEFNIMFMKYQPEVHSPEHTSIQIKHWLAENNLNNFIDMDLPENKYNMQPFLGTCSMDIDQIKMLVLANEKITDFYFT